MKAFQNPSNGSLRHENHWNKKWIYSHLRPPSFCESCQVCSTNTLGIPMNTVASIKLWAKDGSKPGYTTQVFQYEADGFVEEHQIEINYIDAMRRSDAVYTTTKEINYVSSTMNRSQGDRL
jgi:hypothetical protein